MSFQNTSDSAKSDPVNADALPRPERVVIHAAYPVWRKHLLMAVARARELQESGSEVLFTYCDGHGGTCAVNYSGSRIVCSICRSRVCQTAEAAGLNLIPLRATPEEGRPSDTLLLHEKQALIEGVQSGVTSTFRQLAGDSSKDFLIRLIKRAYFATSASLLRSMKTLLDRERPDRIEVFNGRHACSRFCIIAAKDRNIPFNTMEVTACGQPIIFAGHTAHDRIRIQERILRQPADFKLAEQYFSRRRRPKDNKYAKKHSTEFTPPSSSGFRKRITIFLSSQDEFESLGKEWRSPFPDYAEVVRTVCVDNPDYLFCIRFHPNQADMASDITTPFKAIESLPNSVIYYPTDTANTYTLIEWSDIVLTFGSTVTIEACWMGKPAIMLGPSFFDQLDVSYNPKDMTELQELLRRDLAPKDRQNAARLAGFQERDYDPMKFVAHNGSVIVPNGIQIFRPFLSRVARTSDNVFCHVVKTVAKIASKYRKRAA